MPLSMDAGVAESNRQETALPGFPPSRDVSARSTERETTRSALEWFPKRSPIERRSNPVRPRTSRNFVQRVILRRTPQGNSAQSGIYLKPSIGSSPAATATNPDRKATQSPLAVPRIRVTCEAGVLRATHASIPSTPRQRNLSILMTPTASPIRFASSRCKAAIEKWGDSFHPVSCPAQKHCGGENYQDSRTLFGHSVTGFAVASRSARITSPYGNSRESLASPPTGAKIMQLPRVPALRRPGSIPFFPFA
jgi:hypothetical protein